MTTAIRDDALSTLTSAEGTQVEPRVDSTGALWTRISAIASTDLTAIAASLSVLDDWDLTDACKSVALQTSVTATCSAANTIAAAGDYAANDIISNSATNLAGVAWKFTGLTRGNGYTATVVGAKIETSVEAFVARVRMHLFNAAPTTATELDDNAAFYVDLDDRAKYLGYIDLPAMVDGGEFSFAQTDGIAKKITGDSSGDVWAILQLLDAATNESAGMSVWPTLHAVQD